jgi:hypothetical protein
MANAIVAVATSPIEASPAADPMKDAIFRIPYLSIFIMLVNKTKVSNDLRICYNGI